ncbi:MAG: hypothetical protein H6922_00220 [Pseudomonadaceae bacterium]|nr:hypothetical protein [Pseudomonadaceae bacterium]
MHGTFLTSLNQIQPTRLYECGGRYRVGADICEEIVSDEALQNARVRPAGVSRGVERFEEVWGSSWDWDRA